MMSEILQDHGLGKGLNGADKKALIDIVNAADTNASDVKAAVATAIKAKDDRLRLTPESSWGEIQLALSDLGLDYNKVATGSITTGLPKSSTTEIASGIGFKPKHVIAWMEGYTSMFSGMYVGGVWKTKSSYSADYTIPEPTSDGFSIRNTNSTSGLGSFPITWVAFGIDDLPDIPDVYNKVASGKTLTETTGAVTVTGIAFRPSVVVVRAVLSGATYQRVYSAEAVPTGGQLDFIHKQWIRSDINGTQQGNPFAFTDDGFWCDITTTAGVEVAWWAYGKGETPNTFNKVKAGTTTAVGNTLTVTGLGFKPTAVLAKLSNYSGAKASYANVFMPKTNGVTSHFDEDLNIQTANNVAPATPSGQSVNGDGFVLSVAQANSAYDWIAYGEGELPDPPPDSYNRVASGTISANIPAGGTATVSGIGFVPKYIMLHAQGDDVVSVSGDYPQAGTAAGGWRSSSSISNGPRVMTKPTDDSFVITNSNGSIALTAPIVWTAYGVGANPDPTSYVRRTSGVVRGIPYKKTATVKGIGFIPSRVVVHLSYLSGGQIYGGVAVESRGRTFKPDGTLAGEWSAIFYENIIQKTKPTTDELTFTNPDSYDMNLSADIYWEAYE
ncbi:hypothetical protein [Brevibacillus nitrificans]|uniref:hypothetical protein n=1 Tax=Brevibacillus nitrificans TaxID=651560 RepID=UPI00261DEE29|nr:hypothetical protein [Brevibacillus nitrificans]